VPSPSRDPRALARKVRRSPAVRAVAEATRTRRSVATIRRSGLFDEAWYRAQLDPREDADDAIANFVTEGADRGLQPHPLFDPASYLAVDPSASRTSADPFTHFLTRGSARLLDPHPLFDSRLVAERYPEARAHDHGPLGWYLADLDRPLDPPTTLASTADAPTPRAYLDLVRRVRAAHAAVPDHRDAPRTFDTFDHDTAAATTARAASVIAAHDAPPTVSVVVPTKDRADVLPATLDSVLAQSYPHLELVVVDDGSTDATAEVVGRYVDVDERVRFVQQPNAGVAAARNTGVRAATGSLLAYLDSDNTWEPDFLTAAVGTLLDVRARAVYAGSELRSEDRLAYRGRPFDRELILERNYIDCITLVHDRALLDEVGGWDESLRRVVDWDLLLRLSEVTDLVYVPVIASSYDVWDETGDRITKTESSGYVSAVRAKHLLDWEAAPAPVADRDSLVLVTRAVDDDAGHAAARTVAAHLAHARAAGRDLEVVVVDDGTDEPDALRLRLLDLVTPELTLERVADRINLSTAYDLAATRASGDVLLVTDAILELDPAPLATVADEVRRGRATALQPLLVSDHEGTVISSGWRLGAGGVPVQVGWQLAPHDALVVERAERDALDLAAFAVDAAAFRAVRGFDTVFNRMGGAVDLGHRLRAAGGSCAVHAGALAVTDHKPYHRRWQFSADDALELARRHPDASGTLDAWVEGTGVEVAGVTPVPKAAVRGPSRWAPVLRRGAERPRRWAIKIGAEDASDREAWGDWHFAVALRDALAELGEHAVVDLRRGWHRATTDLDDIDVVLRGIAPYDVPPGRTSLLWVISHPTEVTAEEVRRFDHVFVASEPFAEEATARWRRPVEPLLQCTDPSRFAAVPDPALRTEVLFVGNSRGVRRRVVADAIEAGLEPAIWGAGWEGLVPAHLVRGTHVPNHQLGRHYASADVVLADHWDDMRELGFVANRIYDAVACGASVVSDEVAGLDGAFGGAVRTYRDPGELREVVAAAAAAGRDLGADAVAGHTFLDRARRLLAWADEHT
jgi:GT2 family glycosyltransferase